MKVFISHIHEEAPLAFVLKDWIESTFSSVEVFVSSDDKDIQLGENWLQEINLALDDTGVLFILFSPQSVSRPWINFEAGCGWIKGVKTIPICHSGFITGDLDLPLSLFQGINVDEEFPARLIEDIGHKVGMKRLPKLDYSLFWKDIQAAIDQQVLVESEIETDNSVEHVETRISEEGIGILKYLSADGVDSSTLNLIYRSLGFNKTIAEYHIDKLLDAKLIHGQYFLGSPNQYSLSAEGRAYLVENQLI